VPSVWTIPFNKTRAKEAIMVIMGLDLSTHTGLCVVGGKGEVLLLEEIDVGDSIGWDRVLHITSRIMEVHSEFKPDHVVVEDLFVGHASSAIALAQVSLIVQFFFWQEGIAIHKIPATSLKKWLCGSGTAKKELMLMQVYKQFGVTAKNNNEADAIALARLGHCFFTGDDGYTKDQRANAVELFVPKVKETKKKK